MINDKSSQCPGESGSGDLRPDWCRGRGVLAPDVSALDAFVARDSDMERGRPMPEGLVGQPAKNSISIVAVTAALATPVINGVRAALENSFVRSDELIDAGQVRSRSSSRQNVVRFGEEKVGLATSRSSVWIV